MVKKSLCGLTADEIFDLIGPSGFTAVHAVSITNSIYKKSISDISQILKIPNRLKEQSQIVFIKKVFPIFHKS